MYKKRMPKERKSKEIFNFKISEINSVEKKNGKEIVSKLK